MGAGCGDCRIWKIYLWTATAALASCVVGVVPLGSPSWTEGKYGGHDNLQTGLLVFCHDRPDSTSNHSMHCAPLLFGDHEMWFEAVRMLSLLSWIFLFTVLVMSVLLHFQDDRLTFSLPTVILGLLAGLLGVIGALTYIVAWTTRDILNDAYDVNISWGYAVYVIWNVFTLLLFIVVGIAARDIWYSQFTVKSRRQKQLH